MRFTHLALRNVRCFSQLYLSFNGGLNTLYGQNAQGKTTILEALYLLITGRSFRTHSLSEMIRFGETYFYIEGHFEKNGVAQQLKIYYSQDKKTLWHNLTPLSSFSSLFGIINGISLTPEDLYLIEGSPKVRRQMLDIHSAQSSPLYLYHLRRFQGALKQRNALLKTHSMDGIEIWEEQMALSTDVLKNERKALIEELNHSLKNSPFEPLQLHYQTQIPIDYKAALANCRKRDQIYKNTSIGPHKDDFLFLLQKSEAKLYASEGQKRSAVAALRLAQWHTLQKKIETLPPLFIDDLGTSFDRERTNQFLNYLDNRFGQLFVTTAQPSDSLLAKGYSLEVKQDICSALAS